MATIDSRDFVNAIIAGNGWPHVDGKPQSDEDKQAPDNPAVIKIVEYTNAWGKTAWGIVFASDPKHMWGRYEEHTRYVQNPKVIWERVSEGEV